MSAQNQLTKKPESFFPTLAIGAGRPTTTTTGQDRLTINKNRISPRGPRGIIVLCGETVVILQDSAKIEAPPRHTPAPLRRFPPFFGAAVTMPLIVVSPPPLALICRNLRLS